MDTQNKPLTNVESLKKDDIKKPGILRKIKKFAGITLLSASIMLTTNCATNKALIYAAENGHKDVVELLKKAGGH